MQANDHKMEYDYRGKDRNIQDSWNPNKVAIFHSTHVLNNYYGLYRHSMVRNSDIKNKLKDQREDRYIFWISFLVKIVSFLGKQTSKKSFDLCDIIEVFLRF